MIPHPVVFNDLLELLAGQIFTEKYALCTGKDFGGSIIADAKEYFSIVVIFEEFENDLAVLGI